MLSLVAALDRRRFGPRVYVAADGDSLSQQRALKAEQTHAAAGARLETIPRSRRVGQSWPSSVCTTLVALLAALRLVFAVRPRLVSALHGRRGGHGEWSGSERGREDSPGTGGGGV